MLALDTNLIVRYVLRDDPLQYAKSARTIEQDEIFIPITVIQEAYWVLARNNRLPSQDVILALRSICGLPNATVQEPETVAQAMAATERGLDFADALHLAASRHCEAFLTFDRDVIRRVPLAREPA